MLSSNIAVGLRSWQLDEVICILRALIRLIKLLVNLTAFLHLRHVYNLDSIENIISNKRG